MFKGDGSTIIIPASYLRIEVRVIRDFVPGVPEYDEVAVSGASANRGVSIFKKGDIAILDEFTMYPPPVIQVRCRRRTLEGFEIFQGIYPIHRSFVQFGTPPDPQPKFNSKL
ncbi:uncharacterized protein ColSpa_02585 [Colletotrichum spaethianum]|uniref:Uncharacterized protein n=1 Tax=Colletotrichum spaethianum TaxID=700344 RepID=A0AA37L9C0_9PEZI|nr:uncharacterized protein ColSpa_02585 [Colletotrichum spaethianum]GKT42404.1 hypothetical protein ColSpa_02585 [Colletotrichum spaethianum]